MSGTVLNIYLLFFWSWKFDYWSWTFDYLKAIFSFNGVDVVWNLYCLDSGKYVIFNGLLQFIIYTKEKNTILFTDPPPVSSHATVTFTDFVFFFYCIGTQLDRESTVMYCWSYVLLICLHKGQMSKSRKPTASSCPILILVCYISLLLWFISEKLEWVVQVTSNELIALRNSVSLKLLANLHIQPVSF